MQIAAGGAQVSSDVQQAPTNTLQTFTTEDRIYQKRSDDDDLESEEEREEAPVRRKIMKMVKPRAKKMMAVEVEGDGE